MRWGAQTGCRGAFSLAPWGGWATGGGWNLKKWQELGAEPGVRPPRGPILQHCDAFNQGQSQEEPGATGRGLDWMTESPPANQARGHQGPPTTVTGIEATAFCWFFRGRLLLVIKSAELKHRKPQCGKESIHIWMASMHGMYNQNGVWNPHTFWSQSVDIPVWQMSNDDRKHILTYLILLTTTLLGGCCYFYLKMKKLISELFIMWLAQGPPAS